MFSSTRERKNIFKAVDGTAAIEMAVVSPLLFTLVLLFVEIFMSFTAQTIIEDSITSTLRSAKLGVTSGGMTRDEYIKNEIRKRAIGLVKPESLFITNSINKVDPSSHFSNDPAESCVYPSGVKTGKSCPCESGESFEDTNHNGVCDAGTPPLDVGKPGDIVVYSVIYKWNGITPFAKYFGDGNGDYLIVSGGVIRNEPF